jgi:putative endonuclease
LRAAGNVIASGSERHCERSEAICRSEAKITRMRLTDCFVGNTQSIPSLLRMTSKKSNRHCEWQRTSLRAQGSNPLNNDVNQKINLMERGGCVYMMSSLNNSTLYTGVTANLYNRVQQHKWKINPESFTAKYHCIKLVYYCNYPTIIEAISEEKRIKGGSRKKKEELISKMNPDWTDLWEEVEHW